MKKNSFCLNKSSFLCLGQALVYSNVCFFSKPWLIFVPPKDYLDIYQLIKELFPAEWFPISITVIFFLGASRDIPTVSAIYTRPRNKLLKSNKNGLIRKKSSEYS